MSQPNPRPHATRKSLAVSAQSEEFFRRQKTSASDLPSPETFTLNVVRGILEVLAGSREVEQLSRWLSEEVYRTVAVRANLAARARSARGVVGPRTTHLIRSVHLFSPADHVVEATVTASTRVRTRAIALRLEGLDGRWRVTSLGVL
ncbi:Rv3235 family protein [uncultured Microbacterium sp.]|uniref:Rv3235 family protein n=1 Tax=uncultured Microbacterium sp. TaxID=191216 RepID=UPI0025F7D1EC|nr:Rv3235 family protein [uncultured Microbacterium sp.]